jgi:hypothetical protein
MRCVRGHRPEDAHAAGIRELLVMKPPESPTRDQDGKKGAMEEDRPGPPRPDAPALDDNGLPNDSTAIAQDRLGAADDGSQG